MTALPGGADATAAGPGATTDAAPDPGQRLFRLGRSDEYAAQPVALAAVLVLAPALFVACSLLAGGSFPWWLMALTPLGLLLVPRAGSVAVLALWLLLGVVWVATVPGPFSWWCLPAAACVLLAHVASSLLSGSPTTLVWPESTRRRYRHRILVVLAITTAVAALADATLAVHLPGIAALTAAALLGATAWLWAGRLRDAGDDAPTSGAAIRDSPTWE